MKTSLTSGFLGTLLAVGAACSSGEEASPPAATGGAPSAGAAGQAGGAGSAGHPPGGAGTGAGAGGSAGLAGSAGQGAGAAQGGGAGGSAAGAGGTEVGKGGAGTSGSSGQGGAAPVSKPGSFQDQLCNEFFCAQRPALLAEDVVSAWALPDSIWGVAGATFVRRVAGSWQAAFNPFAQALRGVWASSDEDVWGVGDRGALIHWDGKVFSQFASPTQEHLLAVWGSGAKDVWAVGKKGSILHFDGGGWSLVTSSPMPLYAVRGKGADDVYFGGGARPIERYEDISPSIGTITKGQLGHWDGSAITWLPAQNSDGSMLETCTVLSVADSGLVRMLTDLNSVFEVTEHDYLYDDYVKGGMGSCFESGGKDKPWVCQGRSIHEFDGSFNGGNSFPVGASVRAIVTEPVSKQRVALGNGVYTFGSNHAKTTQVMPGDLTSFEPLDDQHLLATTDKGELLSFDGTTWATSALAPALPVRRVDKMSDGTPLAVVVTGQNVPMTYGILPLPSDAAPIPLPKAVTDFSLLAVKGTSTKDLWALSRGASASHWDGQGWTDVALPKQGSLTPLIEAVASEGEVIWVAGAASGIQGYLAYLEGGTWHVESVPGKEYVAFSAIAVRGEEVYVAGTHPTKQECQAPDAETGCDEVRLFRRTAAGWAPMKTPDHMVKSSSAESFRLAPHLAVNSRGVWLGTSSPSLSASNLYLWAEEHWSETPHPAWGVQHIAGLGDDLWVLTRNGSLLRAVK